MGLKTRLRLSIVGLVGAITIILSVLYLRGLAEAEFAHVRERAIVAGQQVQTFIRQLIRSANSEEDWSRIVTESTDLSDFLVGTMASSGGVVDILVTTGNGRILNASNPSRAGTTAVSLQSFLDWDQRSAWSKLREVLSRGQDYEVVVPLGIGNRTVFTVRVIVSTVLVADAVLPRVWDLSIFSLACLFVASLVGILFSNVALRPVVKIGQTIDRITSGAAAREEPAEKSADAELAVVQSKLDMLGQQFRGAKDDASQLRGNIEQMLQNLEDAVLLFDRSDKLLMAGTAVERYLGIGRWDLIGRSLDEVFPADTTLGALVQASTQLRRPIHDHLVAIDDAVPSEARVLLSVEVLGDSQNRIGTMVTIRDAETRLQIESQLQVSQRLSAISRIAGGVAHEIKNPLNAISVHLEILKGKLAGDITDDIDSIAVIGRELARLDRVVKTFLDFTRPVELQMSEVDLTALAHDVSALMRPQAERQNITVDVELETERATIHGDRDLLLQAVLNVVTNGIEAMSGAGGALSIKLKPFDGGFLFSIADTGPGIPPEARNKIFNLYFTTKQRGSGIGLAATFRIVQLHNATIEFASEVGHGTTFTFHFPAASRSPLDRAVQAGQQA